MEDEEKTTKQMLSSNGSTVDDVLHEAGDFGRYQFLQLLILSGMVLLSAMPIFVIFFAAHNPPWRCVSNTTCSPQVGEFSTGSTHYENRCRLPRNQWEYTTADSYSMATQFGLYCDKEWIIYVLKSIAFVGWGIGAIILGAVGDRFGRKKVLAVSIIMISITSIVISFSPNVWMAVALQFLRGFFIPGVAVGSFIMSSEIVGPKKRPLSGISLFFIWVLVLCVLGMKAYFVREWKTLTLICILPYVPLTIGVLFVPESIRWLRLNDRDDEAVQLLQKIGRINKKPLDDVKLIPLTDAEKNTKSTYLDIFWPFPVLLRTIIQWFAWMSCGLVYYGVTFASDNLGGSMYRDFILASLVEFPANAAAIFLCNRLGRKPTVTYPMFVTAAVLVVVSLIPEDSDLKYLRVVFGIIGKFCITLSFNSIYTWSVELYPTAVRSKGMGALQVAARIGSAAAPWIANALRVHHVAVPFIVMAVFSLVAGVLLFWLPETRDRRTLETLSDLSSKESAEDVLLLAVGAANDEEDCERKA